MAGSASPGAQVSAWAEHRTAQGRVYWYHRTEKRSVWDKPDELKSARERAMETTPWREYKSGERSYYVNKETKASTWTMPPDLKAFLDTIPDEPAPAVATRGSASPKTHDSPAGGATPQGASTPEPMGPGTAVPRTSSMTGSAARAAPVMFASFEEAEEAFIQLLRRKGVTADATWENTLRNIVTEPLYKALRSLADRKAAFHKYVSELKEIAAAERADKEAALAPRIRKHLQQQRAGPLRPYNSFATFQKRMQYTGLLDDIDDDMAHSLFETLRGEAQEADAARRKHIDNKGRQAFTALLATIDMRPTTLWRDVHRTIVESAEYQRDSRLAQLPLPVMISLFEEHMATVEAEAHAERAKESGAHGRQDRQARDAFKALLASLVERGQMHARSTWASVYAQLRDDKRLDAMMRTQGSSAQDLFYDELDRLEREFSTQKQKVHAYMQQRQLRAAQDTDWPAWRDACREDGAPSEVRGLADGALRALFDECVYQAERDARDARRRAERRLRHYVDDLRFAFKRAEPPLDIAATFDDVAPRIRAMPEFKALPGADADDVARGAWEKFARRQAEKLADAAHAPGRSRTDYADLDDAPDDRKRKEPPRAVDPRAVRRRTEYDP